MRGLKSYVSVISACARKFAVVLSRLRELRVEESSESSRRDLRARVTRNNVRIHSHVDRLPLCRCLRMRTAEHDDVVMVMPCIYYGALLPANRHHAVKVDLVVSPRNHDTSSILFSRGSLPFGL